MGQSGRGILWAEKAACDPPSVAENGDLVTPQSFQVVRKSWQCGEVSSKASQVDDERLSAVLEPLELMAEGLYHPVPSWTTYCCRWVTGVWTWDITLSWSFLDRSCSSAQTQVAARQSSFIICARERLGVQVPQLSVVLLLPEAFMALFHTREVTLLPQHSPQIAVRSNL